MLSKIKLKKYKSNGWRADPTKFPYVFTQNTVERKYLNHQVPCSSSLSAFISGRKTKLLAHDRRRLAWSINAIASAGVKDVLLQRLHKFTFNKSVDTLLS